MRQDGWRFKGTLAAFAAAFNSTHSLRLAEWLSRYLIKFKILLYHRLTYLVLVLTADVKTRFERTGADHRESKAIMSFSIE